LESPRQVVMKYVISDIHGIGSKFMEMMNLINFSMNDVLYILSDIIDINAEFLKIINFIKNNPNVF